MDHKHNINNITTIAGQSSFTSSSNAEDCLPTISTHNSPRVLFIEPFYGGSHKQLIDLLTANILGSTLITLSAKKWHWRARCSALVIYKSIPFITTETTLFCSSVLNLCELLGLRHDLHKLKKILYFHENQLIYPIREIKERDVQYAYNQIISCLAADIVIFNSQFNKNSFLNNISKILKLLPDNRPKNLKEDIEKKCLVLYFPITLPKQLAYVYDNILHIVWPHRWEFDKNPEEFLRVILKLKANDLKFKICMLGQGYKDVPDVFNDAKDQLVDEICQYGYVASKADYLNLLSKCHVAVSTAIHEFFGVSMIEAVSCGCYPLVPNRLVYVEIYPKECLYNDEIDLYERLEYYCKHPDESIRRRNELKINLEQYSVENLLPKYLDILL